MSRISFEFDGDIQDAIRAVKNSLSNVRDIVGTDAEGKTYREDGSSAEPAALHPEHQAPQASSQSPDGRPGAPPSSATSTPPTAAPPNNPTTQGSKTTQTPTSATPAVSPPQIGKASPKQK